MSTDFNRKGRQMAGVFVKKTPPYFNVLNQEARALSDEVENSISTSIQCTDKTSLSIPADGCFARFRGCVLQVSRLAHHESMMRASAPQQIGIAVCLRGAEALVDFESLLFHGRGALDRAAFFVAKKIYNQDCDKYPKLRNILRNFGDKDPRAVELLGICNAVDPFFAGVLYDTQSGQKSLRSHVMHKSTASENAVALFTLHSLGNHRRIAFDAILRDYPLFRTAHKLAHGLTFLIVNALSLYVGPGRILDLPKCEPAWHCQMVDFWRHESDGQNAVAFTIWSTIPSGCVLRPVRLRPEVADEAY